MARKIYAQEDHLNTRIINVADPTLAQDAATKNYIDGLAATVAPNLQDRWAGYITNFTVPHNTYIGITGWVANTARGITEGGGTLTATKTGVYAINVSGAFSGTGLSTAQVGLLEIVHPLETHRNNAATGDVYVNCAAIIGMNTQKSFYCTVFQTTGTTRTISLILSVVRVSEI